MAENPKNISEIFEELLDDELDQVSGGFDWEDFERFRQFLDRCKIHM